MKKEELKGYYLAKKIESDISTIEVYRPHEISLNEERQNLINLYDTVHEISKSVESRGVDVSDWFYTSKQIEQMKKDSNYKFI